MVIKIKLLDFDKKPPFQITIDGEDRKDIRSIDSWNESGNYGKGEWIDEDSFCLTIPDEYVFLENGKLGFANKKIPPSI